MITLTRLESARGQEENAGDSRMFLSCAEGTVEEGSGGDAEALDLT